MYKGQHFKNSGEAKHGTPYEILILLSSLFLGIEALYFVRSNQEIDGFIGLIDKVLDTFLLIIVLKKIDTRKEAIALMVSIALGAICYLCSSSIILIKAYLYIYGAKGEKYYRILYCCLIGFSMSILLGVGLSIFGMSSPDQFRRGGYGLGFGHPNQAALFASISLTLLLILELNSRKSLGRRIVSLCLACALLLCVWLTGSRTALLTPILAIGFAFTLAPVLIVVKRKDRILQWLSCLSAPIMFVFSLLTAWLFNESTVVQNLDDLLNYRIWLNWFALDHFNLTLFGQVADFNVEGVFNPIRGVGNITTTVDNTYVSGLLSYGIIPVLLWLASTVVASKRALDANDHVLFGFSIALSIYAFMEAQFMNPLLYLSLLGIFSTIDGPSDMDSSRKKG